jgi:hypothetical protein
MMWGNISSHLRELENSVENSGSVAVEKEFISNKVHTVENYRNRKKKIPGIQK